MGILVMLLFLQCMLCQHHKIKINGTTKLISYIRENSSHQSHLIHDIRHFGDAVLVEVLEDGNFAQEVHQLRVPFHAQPHCDLK